MCCQGEPKSEGVRTFFVYTTFLQAQHFTDYVLQHIIREENFHMEPLEARIELNI